MLALDRKLWRQLWQMRLQALAIAMVVASGVAIFIMSLSALDSLTITRDNYYREHHFAQVFANLKRAPLSVTQRIQAIPGVEKVETRVVTYVNLDIEGFGDPVSGHLISLPDHGTGLLNRLFLRSGRLVEPGRDNEIVLSEKFATAHNLQPGSKIKATINGRQKTLTVVGTALSPEYVYQIAPGAMFPDYQRYGVMWMARAPLASAYDMEGAFNDVTLTLRKGTQVQEVIDRLDDILTPYGGTGAYDREDQLSNLFLNQELKGLETQAGLFPFIFFGVAAFLLNVVISRLIALEREQVAILKAFGYSAFAIGVHYSKLVIMIVSVGIVLGSFAGIWMGQSLSQLYMQFFSFPFLDYILKPWVLSSAALVSILVAIAGTLFAVHKAVKLSPAEGMRPEQPAVFRPTVVERMGLQRHFSQSTRMILRHIERRPFKALLTTLGISMAFGIMMLGGFQEGAINRMVDVQFNLSQREDFMTVFTEPTSTRAIYSLKGLQGVEHVEGFRTVAAKLQFEHRSYRTSVQGIEPEGQLRRLVNTDLQNIDLPQDGLILTDYLAKLLNIKPGDLLTIQVLEGDRPTLQVPVVATLKEYIGVNVYLQRQTLNRLLHEGDVLSGVLMKVDEPHRQAIFKQLKQMPRIVGVIEQRASIDSFYQTMDETILFFTFITTLLGASIAFGVVYNSMRIALSERDRELASLRVLGYHRSEVAYILLGELGLLTLLATPIGFLVGYGLCAYLALEFETDLYRIPLVLGIDVYAFAALVVIGSAILSASLIWRNLAHLDMVGVLKAKE